MLSFTGERIYVAIEISIEISNILHFFLRINSAIF